MTSKIKLLSLILLITLYGCSSTKFFPYDGSQEVTGSGGFKSNTVNGVTFYENGLPNGQKCKIIGKVTDSYTPNIFLTYNEHLARISDEANKNKANSVLIKSTKETLNAIVQTSEKLNKHSSLSVTVPTKKRHFEYILFNCSK